MLPTNKSKSSYKGKVSTIGIINNSNINAIINSLQKDNVTLQFVPATVVDIILDSSHDKYKEPNDIGKILVSFHDNAENTYTSLVTPLSYNIEYPYKNEVVLVMELWNELYYLNPINEKNDVTNNILSKRGTGIYDTSKPEEGRKFNKKPQMDFGDKIIYGRGFNFIKFKDNSDIKISSTETDSADIEPNSVFQDETNNYRSIIWLLSDDIDFQPATFEKSHYLRSTESYKKTIDKSILISSDKVVINSNLEDISLFSNKGLYFNTNGYIGMDSINNIQVTTKANFIFESKNAFHNCEKIYLGPNAPEPVVLGDTLISLLEELIDAMLEEKHMTGTGLSDAPFIDTKIKYKKIKAKLKTALSKWNKTR